MYRSKSLRFVDNVEAAGKPGPGAYALRSVFTSLPRKNKTKREMSDSKGSRPQSVETLLRLMELTPTVPSIPNKFQSYGYDTQEGGNPSQASKLTLQMPSYAVGYSGVGADCVGPLDYDPILPTKQSSSSVKIIAKVSHSIQYKVHRKLALIYLDICRLQSHEGRRSCR